MLHSFKSDNILSSYFFQSFPPLQSSSYPNRPAVYFQKLGSSWTIKELKRIHSHNVYIFSISEQQRVEKPVVLVKGPHLSLAVTAEEVTAFLGYTCMFGSVSMNQ